MGLEEFIIHYSTLKESREMGNKFKVLEGEKAQPRS